MDKSKNSHAITGNSSQAGVIHLTDNSTTLTLEDLQILMTKAARLASLKFVSYMRKEGLL